MKMTPVKEVPGKTGHYCNLQGGSRSLWLWTQKS